MGEKVEDQDADVDINSEITFDNFTIIKELSNIVNLVKNEDFLITVPKAKLKRIQWVPMFNFLKQAIFDEMIQELNSVWEYENMPTKFEIVEKQKEKFTEINSDIKLWRPQLANVKSQLKVHDMMQLQKQKIFLESLAKEYEAKVNRLEKTLIAKREYLKVLQIDIHKYQKKNEDICSKLEDKIKKQQKLTEVITPAREDIEDMCWLEK